MVPTIPQTSDECSCPPSDGQRRHGRRAGRLRSIFSVPEPAVRMPWLCRDGTRLRILLAGAIALLSSRLEGQTPVDSTRSKPAASTPIIQDNSFLIEEAYNQTPGV